MTVDSDSVTRFPRGFALSVQPIDGLPAEWAMKNVAGLRLWHALDVPVEGAQLGRYFVVVIGQFIDTDMWRPRADAIATAVRALSESDEGFLDVTDAWSGRYLLAFGTTADRKVMTDATGMRSAFYSIDGSLVVASHARLVAMATGAGRSAISAEYRTCVRALRSSNVTPMPGRSTPWSGVVFLTANQVLDVETRELRRVFPRRPTEELATMAAAGRIAPRLQGQVTALVNTGRPVALSLTGGIDSRMSLAASRQVRDSITYFTYRRPGMAKTDADVAAAGSIASALGLRHRVLDVGAGAEPEALDLAIREATTLSHGRAIVTAYRRAFRADTIHIRSNIGEVGRCFYRSTWRGALMPDSAGEVTAEVLARLWAHGAPSQPILEAFDDWIEATGFGHVRGLDPLDLFYWEHRMACWHANVVLESDFAFDTHVLFNSRTILELMLSAPANDRCNGALVRHVVSLLWPELLRWPMGRSSLRSRVVSIGRRLRS